MSERIFLSPLTPEERDFAEQHHDALEWCMKSMRLSDDQYGIAAIGYIHAVKKWFARPELQKWSFRTIVKNTVRSHLSTEKRKEERCVSAVSLNDVIPGTEGLTHESSITYSNLAYARREGTTMKPSYDVKIPETAKIGRTPSVEVELVVEFLTSTHKTMCFEYPDKKEANSKASTLRAWKQKNNREDVNIYKMADKIFIEKSAKTKRGEKKVGKTTEV